MSQPFVYDHPRARKARFAARLKGNGLFVLYGVTLLVALSGAYLTVLGVPLGWWVFSLTVWPLVVVAWYHGELRELPPQPGDAIADRLEGDVLAQLPQQPSPRDIAHAAMQSTSGQFFAGRFGVASRFLEDMSSQNPDDATAVWQRADEIIAKCPGAILDGAVLVAALASTQTGVRAVLPHLQLDEKDLIAGVGWYTRLAQLVRDQKRHRASGGIARDWSFGYTPLLSRFGVSISDQVARGGLLHVRLDAHQEALNYMLQIFGTNARQNVALVGPLGVGKTSVVHAFAEQILGGDRAVPQNLRYRQVVSLDASALISSAQTRGELESLVNRLLVEAYKAKNIILCLDDAQLFFEDAPGSVDLTSILLPILEGGRLRMILTMDEQRWLRIAQRNPALVAALNRVGVAPADQRETLAVLQDRLIAFEFRRNVTYMYQALKEAYRLSERYLHDQGQPGRAVMLLESAAGFAEHSIVTAASVQMAIERTQGVKVGGAVGHDSDERDKLLRLEELIHERMINQTRAVSVVSDAIRRARAGVRNEGRPIGTFLFLGPTGVGKTELAKSLAAVYFGGEERMVRLDMNEYVRADDVARLIADGAQDPHSLTASIMKQPFSVVLLDEIEKAHPQVLTTLLQLLDEGVLRDINNREVSFRDAIVIATSNAGADRIRELIGQGRQLEECEELLVNELIDSQQFRPEFLNRFDEIVVFRPLTTDELVQVIDLIVAGINKTLAHQQVTVTLDDATKRKLAQIGYDPRLGARPMRRVVQRSVESLIARRMLEGSVSPGQAIEIREADIKI